MILEVPVAKLPAWAPNGNGLRRNETVVADAAIICNLKWINSTWMNLDDHAMCLTFSP
jgi:hypothetical protein